MPWKQKLIDKLTMARGRKIATDTVEGILDLFETIKEVTARKVVKEICLLDNLPTNIYGAIEKKYNELEQLRKDSENWKFNHRDDCEADKYPADIKSLWDFIEEHMIWHQTGLITEIYTAEPMDIDEWIKRGRPILCCKLHDSWMHGFEDAYKKELCNPESGAIEKFTKEYTEKLKQYRINQLTETATVS
jgi:hypothetical protein